MKDRPAVALPKSGNARQFIHHAGREQKKLTLFDLSARQPYFKAGCDRYGSFHSDVPLFDPVLLELRAAQGIELGRRNTISGQISMERGRSLIPRFSEVAH
jgi:hypothetical protein